MPRCLGVSISAQFDPQSTLPLLCTMLSSFRLQFSLKLHFLNGYPFFEFDAKVLRIGFLFYRKEILSQYFHANVQFRWRRLSANRELIFCLFCTSSKILAIDWTFIHIITYLSFIAAHIRVLVYPLNITVISLTEVFFFRIQSFWFKAILT